MWKIKDVLIKNQVVVAPMAGVSDATFRYITELMQAGLVYTEMISAEAIVRDNKKTLEMLDFSWDICPVAVQIFGSDPDVLAKAAQIIYEKYPKISIIDINMGCPVPKIAERSKSGSALLKNPELIRSIVSSVVASVPIPVTVKIRSGWNQDSINAPLIAKIAEDAGASAIAIHGRTRAQGYSGSVDKNIIKEVVNAVKIPVIGNGDIRSCYDAGAMLKETGCAAIMIGRAVMGNPWLIKECVEYLDSGKIPTEIGFTERIEMMKYHLNLLCQEKSESQAILEIRTHLLSYLKSLPNNKEIKNTICTAKSKQEIINIIDNYKKANTF